jgi:hypothetical protein
MKRMDAGPDVPRTMPREPDCGTEELDHHLICLPCDKFGDFFRCSVPSDCRQSQACLRLWMSRCEFEKGSVGWGRC